MMLTSATNGDATCDDYCGCNWDSSQTGDHWFMSVDDGGIAYATCNTFPTEDEINNCKENS